MRRPVIGITLDNREPKAGPPAFELRTTYIDAVDAAGGAPLCLPQVPACAETYVGLCDGMLLTGGNDVRMEGFGVATHSRACTMDPRRQAFEFALLAALDRRPELPVLGICLGMQLMAMHAGGMLDQHLPDVLGEEAAARHAGDHRHAVLRLTPDTRLPATQGLDVASYHHQAVRDPGRLRIVARADDGVVEAVDDPGKPFYLGVQWHPERTGPTPLGAGLIAHLVEACRDRS